jgi:hypothetical protein
MTFVPTCASQPREISVRPHRGGQVGVNVKVNVKVNVNVYGPIESSAMRSITCALSGTRGIALFRDA